MVTAPPSDGRFNLASKRPLQTCLPCPMRISIRTMWAASYPSLLDEPLVAFHAVRNLAGLGLGVVDYNWMELGLGRLNSTQL